MKSINFLIKPSSSKCNMACKYCFYYDIADNRDIKDYGWMSEETAEAIIKKGLNYVENGQITFAFQGGEPTLIGLEFYKYFTCKVKELNTRNAKVQYAIQTNGFTINDDWAEFFVNNNFLVGLSLDGPKVIHDLNRLDKGHNGTYKKIINAANIFKKHNVQFNILVVVSKIVSRKIEQIYKFFKKEGFTYLQFIPCLDELDTEQGKSNYSISSQDYAKFLKRLFDLWYQDYKNGYIVSIRYFDNILSMYLGMEPESCDMRGMCSIQNVVEADGSVYPCDFYVLDKYKMGNINETSIEELFKQIITKLFIEESLPINEKCKTCKWVNLCRGGCKRHQIGEDNLNRFCEAYQEFFEYSHERFIEISYYIKQNGR